jgi:hypothetical protein
MSKNTLTPKKPRAENGIRKLAPAKLKQVTANDDWKVLRKEIFKSIKSMTLRLAGIDILVVMDQNPDKEISAGQIIEIFKKRSISLYGGKSFHTELARISNALHKNNSCRIKKVGDISASTDPDRKFGIFLDRKGKIGQKK